MNKKKVSIVIPCFNDGKYIKRAVRSALDQTYANKEIIIIDDGSNARTKKVLNKLKKDISILITQENRGVCVARNKGIALASGEYILTLDADDFFEPSFVTQAVDIIETGKHIGMVTCYAKLFNSSGVYDIQKPKGGTKETFIFNNGAYACVLFRKACWQEVGGYDINMTKGYEDWEFNIAITKAGWEVAIIPQPLFNYRNKSGSRNKSVSNEDNIGLVKYIYVKHKELYIQNFELTVNHIFNKLEVSRSNLNNIKRTKGYGIGKKIFYVLNFIKEIIIKR